MQAVPGWIRQREMDRAAGFDIELDNAIVLPF